MDLRQIRYFVAACEEGSLSAAATRLHCTASGISQQMSALEARLGAGLLERTRRGVNPTAAGWRFYDRCLAILKAVSEAEMELEDFSAGLNGTVSAGFAPGLAKTVLPQTLARYTREFPKVDIEIGSGTADALVAEASGGVLDFYVGQFAKPQIGLAAMPIGRYPVALISGSRRGFMPMKPIRLHEVAPLKLSVPSANTQPAPEDRGRHPQWRDRCRADHRDRQPLGRAGVRGADRLVINPALLDRPEGTRQRTPYRQPDRRALIERRSDADTSCPAAIVAASATALRIFLPGAQAQR